MNAQEKIRNHKKIIAKLAAQLRKHTQLLRKLKERERAKAINIQATLPRSFFRKLPQGVDIDALDVALILPEKKHFPGQPGGQLTRIESRFLNLNIATIGDLKKSSKLILTGPSRAGIRRQRRWGDYDPSEPRPTNFGRGCATIVLASMKHHRIKFEKVVTPAT
jgi:hypothetical protein